MTTNADAVPNEPTREQVNAALLAFYPSDWTRAIQFDAMKRALMAAALCAPAEVRTEAVRVGDAARDMLADAVDRTIQTIERQLELIEERAPGDFLNKRPVVQSLMAHKGRLHRALAEIERIDRAASSAGDQGEAQ